MAVRSTLIIAGELVMNWELEWRDSLQKYNFLRLKSGATYALGMCIVLDVYQLTMMVYNQEAIKLQLTSGKWYSMMGWESSAQMLGTRYTEMTQC